MSFAICRHGGGVFYISGWLMSFGQLGYRTIVSGPVIFLYKGGRKCATISERMVVCETAKIVNSYLCGADHRGIISTGTFDSFIIIITT